MLKGLLLAVAQLVFRLWAGRWLDPNPQEEAYAAKAKEAEALAKPDAGWSDTVDRL